MSQVWSAVGRLGADPVAHKGGKTAFATGSLAVDTYDSGARGTLWVGLKVWGNQAERLVEMCRKGTAIYVYGELRLEEHEERQYLRCNVTRWSFAPSQPADRDAPVKQGAAGQGQKKRGGTQQYGDVEFGGEADTDLPF